MTTRIYRWCCRCNSQAFVHTKKNPKVQFRYEFPSQNISKLTSHYCNQWQFKDHVTWLARARFDYEFCSQIITWVSGWDTVGLLHRLWILFCYNLLNMTGNEQRKYDSTQYEGVYLFNGRYSIINIVWMYNM